MDRWNSKTKTIGRVYKPIESDRSESFEFKKFLSGALSLSTTRYVYNPLTNGIVRQLIQPSKNCIS